MTECVGHDCGTPVDDANLCAGCTELLARRIGSLGAWARELDITIARQARLGDRGPGGAVQPVPFDEHASADRDLLNADIRGLVRLLHPVNNPAGAPASSSIDDMATWLLAHLEDIRHHPAAARVEQTVYSAIRRVWRRVDRPPVTVYAGPCDTPIGDPDTTSCGCACHHGGPFTKCDVDGGCWQLHDQPTCGADLYAIPRRTVVRCRACGTDHDVQARREWLAATIEDMWVTSADAGRLLAILDVDLPSTTIRKWAERNQLVARTLDPAGRPLYRAGDILDLNAQRLARAHQRTERRGRKRQAS